MNLNTPHHHPSYHLSSLSMNLSNLFLKQSIVLALTTCLLSLFHLSTTLSVNQFFPMSFLNLNFSSIKPLALVTPGPLTVSTLLMSPLLNHLTHLNTSIKSPLNLRLSSECSCRRFNLSLYSKYPSYHLRHSSLYGF